MKNLIGLFVITLVLGISLQFTGCSSESDIASSTDSQVLLKTSEVTDAVSDGLLFMVEEEKLARDVYLYFYEKYQSRVFTNIARSEQRHIDAVTTMINYYELDLPWETDTQGSFVNEDLQELYNTLIEKGNESLVAALEVGATIEEVDILDLIENLEMLGEDYPDITRVYVNLGKGSENHLRAFVRNLSAQGVTYSPNYLTEEQYIAIVGE